MLTTIAVFFLLTFSEFRGFSEFGQIAVIGISQQASHSEDESSTHFLKDIPILGRVFKSGGSRDVDTHIVFAVQARILKTPEEDLAESVRQRLALERGLSKVTGLRRSRKTPYAVLVTTRSVRSDALALAESFERDGLRAQVGAWSGFGVMRYDVYLTGYSSLAVAGGDALRLTERGFEPQVVVLPGEVALAKSPGLRLLGSPTAVP